MFSIKQNMTKYILSILTLCICFVGGWNITTPLHEIESITEHSSENRDMIKNKTREVNLPLMYSKNSDKGYYVENILQANFYEAMYYCKYHGMELLSILSREDEDSVLEILEDLGIEKGTNFLTSAKSMQTTDRNNNKIQSAWVWLASGKPMKYKPSDLTLNQNEREGCITLEFDTLGWYRHNCQYQSYFICETV